MTWQDYERCADYQTREPLFRPILAFLGLRSIPLFTCTRACQGILDVPVSHLILIADHLGRDAGIGDVHMKDRLTVRAGEVGKVGLELAPLPVGSASLPLLVNAGCGHSATTLCRDEGETQRLIPRSPQMA